MPQAEHSIALLCFALLCFALLVAALGAGHWYVAFSFAAFRTVIIGLHQAQAGRQVLLLAHFGASALQGLKVLVGFVFAEVTLDVDIAAVKQRVDPGLPPVSG